MFTITPHSLCTHSWRCPPASAVSCTRPSARPRRPAPDSRAALWARAGPSDRPGRAAPGDPARPAPPSSRSPPRTESRPRGASAPRWSAADSDADAAAGVAAPSRRRPVRLWGRAAPAGPAGRHNCRRARPDSHDHTVGSLPDSWPAPPLLPNSMRTAWPGVYCPANCHCPLAGLCSVHCLPVVICSM
jgi:hypothetical protein